MDCMYYAFGEIDVVGIADFPDEASAVAFSLLVNSSGAVELSLTPLMDPAVLDAVAARDMSYRPPAS